MLKCDINDGSEEVDRRAVGFLPPLQTVKDTTIATYKKLTHATHEGHFE